MLPAANSLNMKMQELKTKSISELHQLLAEAREELRELTFKSGEGQLPQVRRIREVRTRIARIGTALNQALATTK